MTRLKLLSIIACLWANIGFSQQFTKKDIIEIQYQARFMLDQYEFMLTTITSDLYNPSEIENVIYNSLHGNNRLFYNTSAVIEDDIDPRAYNKEFRKDVSVNRYLNDYNIFYNKSDDPTIHFSHLEFSEVYFKDYPYIKMRFTKEMNSYNRDVPNIPYFEKRRVVEFRIQNNNKIELKINSIVFDDDQVDFIKTEATQFDNDIDDYGSFVNQYLDLQFEIQNQEELNKRKLEFYEALDKGEQLLKSGSVIEAQGHFETAKIITGFEGISGVINNEDLIKPRQQLKKIEELERKRIEAEELERIKSQGYGYYINKLREEYSTRKFKDAKKTYEVLTSEYQNIEIPMDINVHEILEVNTLLKSLESDVLYNDINVLLKEYSNVIESNPDYPELYKGRAVIYHKKGDFNKALEDINKSIRLATNYQEAIVLRGNINTSLQKYDNAIKDYLSALALDSTKAEIYVQLAKTSFQNNKRDQGYNYILKATQMQPDNPDFHFEKGNLYLIAGEKSKAYEAYSESILKGETANPYFERGKISWQKGEKQKASDDFRAARAIGIDDNQKKFLKDLCKSIFDKGLTHQKNKEIKSALNFYDEAISIYDGFPYMLYRRGKLNYREGELRRLDPRKKPDRYYERSASDFDQMISVDESWDSAYYYLGRCYTYLREFDKAQETFNRILNIDADFHIAKMGKGINYFAKGGKKNNAIAIDELRNNYLLEYENHPEARFYLGRARINAKEFQLAIEELKKATLLRSKYGEAYVFLAKAKYLNDPSTDKYLRIIEPLAAATENGIESDSIYNMLGRLQFLYGDYKGATNSCHQSLLFNTKQDSVRVMYADLLAREFKWKEAILQMEKARKRNKNVANAEYYSNLARYYLGLEDHTNASKYCEESLKLSDNARAYFIQCCIFIDKKQFDTALEKLEQALKKNVLTSKDVSKNFYIRKINKMDEYKILFAKYLGD